MPDQPKPGSKQDSIERQTAQNVRLIAELENAAHLQRTLGDRVADAITRFCGTMVFLWVHVAWFAIWIFTNSILRGRAVDPFPFNLLTLAVSLEAIFLSTFILISENRQSRVDERRSHLDLQINLLAEQENTKMLKLLKEIAQKVGVESHNDPEIAVLEQATLPQKLLQQIDATVQAEGEKPAS